MIKLSIRNALISTTLTLSLLLLPGAAFAADSQQTATTGTTEATQASDTQLIQEVLDYISAHNVSGVKREELIRAAIEGMIYQLDDPYTSYFTADELKQFQDSINQDYVGIGVTLYFDNNKLYVDSVISGSPAEKSGLKAGDVITRINGEAVTGPDTAAGLAGEENTQVTVTVQRSGKTLSFSVTRAEIFLPTVNAAITDSKIGYIQLTSFAENADEDFADALSKLQASGMKSLVLDLRDNGGGYIDTANNIAKHFIDKGILMYTQDQSGLLVPQTITDGVKIGVPVVVVTNENSASASEILTGALRDNHVATTVGTTTYGKARIQNVISLSNGDALKLTTEKYLTPSKEDFNKIGLKPDFEVKNSTAQLITAFSLAGMKTMKISGDNHSLSVNGKSFSGTLDTIKKGSSIYVPARVLTSLVLGEVAWNAKDKKIIVTDGRGQRNGFTVASNQVVFQNQESYIEIHAFVKKYPSLKWSYSQNKLTLSTP
ncbi:S41 family peptidase [Paenibacillus zeisoli]|uniref:S41 family peptidase n=1 Tax=Paenibacillus zeisoli TaxID=2496267 RepID=A0A433X4Q9_9BACL|nr:S41 family peptidase [Paenibacillus zeisoli]RUT29066.1 S41 family peptidase [Paenibacillus zeisoli]